ncbi:YaiI/YqxD family protein [Tepidamorphus sp. 3E244]|uniref:YaiI/YqxD family protein n=1 Tax=Tepidamorphus sp. 3E244 TaxID=3385498 RepID=UPI0038FC17B2
MTTIYIDADACPVKEEAILVAGRNGADVLVVSNGGIRPYRDDHVKMIYVPDGLDVADDWIAERIGPGDICITTDIPLASRCVKAGGLVLKPNGEALTDANIGAVLATRNLMTDLREQGAVQSRHASFGARERSNFKQALERVLRQLR